MFDLPVYRKIDFTPCCVRYCLINLAAMAQKRKESRNRRPRHKGRGKAPGFQVDRRGSGGPSQAQDGPYWIYGTHAALAAIANPKRRCHQILMTSASKESLETEISAAVTAAQGGRPQIELRERGEIADQLPGGAVHQGIAVRVDPLADIGLPNALAAAPENAPILILDQANDPHNVGAVLRSAAAFGAAFVVCQTRHAPGETSILAKSASGALEVVSLISVTNIARAMIIIKDAGYWCVGLDGQTEKRLDAANFTNKTALIFGAEGAGLRRLTRESCDELIRIPMSGQMESLNLSNAAAVTLYELQRSREN